MANEKSLYEVVVSSVGVNKDGSLNSTTPLPNMYALGPYASRQEAENVANAETVSEIPHGGSKNVYHVHRIGEK